MDGITVLKSYEAVAYTTWGWSWPGFIVALGALVILILSVYYTIKDKNTSNLVPGLIILLFMALMSTAIFAEGTKIKQPYYDVYIHGTINMDEFNERYKVIKQDGLIYTITENTAN